MTLPTSKLSKDKDASITVIVSSYATAANKSRSAKLPSADRRHYHQGLDTENEPWQFNLRGKETYPTNLDLLQIRMIHTSQETSVRKELFTT